MANHMSEVAKMLGVELGEIFEIKTDVYKSFQFRFVENDFQCFNGKRWVTDANAPVFLKLLLTGEYTIKRKPWKPKYEETYWYIDEQGESWGSPFTDSDYINYYKLGNCYRTREEAEANRDKWVAFYASDEVLEV